MLRKEKNGVVWYESTLFQEFSNIVHGSFTRIGGVSQGAYDSLNIGAGDDSCNIQENKKRILEALTSQNHTMPTLISAEQVHKTNIEIVDCHREFLQTDGLLSNNKNHALLIKHADCQVALFYDPINKAIGAIHSGWRGNVQNIYQKTVQLFKAKFNTNPNDLFVFISPSLGPQKSQFINYKTELPEEFLQFEISPYYFDFWSISRWQLQLSGVLPHHIEIASQCTYLDKDRFFSYRRDGKASGRHATVIWLRS